jgi:hypothetical protein
MVIVISINVYRQPGSKQKNRHCIPERKRAVGTDRFSCIFLAPASWLKSALGPL